MPVPSLPQFQNHLGRSVTIDQAAQMLGVSRRTIYYRIRDGRLRTIRTLGGSQRVLIESMREQRHVLGEPLAQSVPGGIRP